MRWRAGTFRPGRRRAPNSTSLVWHGWRTNSRPDGSFSHANFHRSHGRTSMQIVVLGGAGIIGRVIALDLARDDIEIVIGDRDLAGAERTAQQVGKRARAVQIDVTDVEALAKVLRGAAVCVNSTLYYYNLDVMRACLKAKVNYLDLGGLFHVTRQQLELDRDFRDGGLTAVLGLGSCPGVANVQAGWLGGGVERGGAGPASHQGH